VKILVVMVVISEADLGTFLFSTFNGALFFYFFSLSFLCAVSFCAMLNFSILPYFYVSK